MTDKMMDGPLRDKLDGYSSPVPEGAFGRIMAARERKKRRPVAYWYLVPALLLLGGGLYLGMRQNSTDPKASLAKDDAPKPRSTTPTGMTTIPTEQDDGVSPAHDRDDVRRLPSTKPSATDKNYTLRSFSDREHLTHDATKPGNALVESHRRTKGRTSAAFAPSEPDVKSSLSSEGPAVPLTTSVGTLKGLVFPAPSTGVHGNQPLAKQATELLGPTQRFCLPPCMIPGCPDFREYRNDWYVEAFASADMPFKTLQEPRDKSDFVQHKDSTEKMLLSFSAGLRVSKNLTNNLLLKTGFHYSQWNERFDYKNENERRIVTVITIRTVIRGPGDTLLVRDTSQVETVGTRVKRTYNTYRNIDIPVILSWELRKPDFTIGIQGGLLFNVKSAYRGDMLDTTMVPMSQTPRNPASQLRTSWGLGLYAGVSFIKPVSPVLDIFAEPWYRVYLKNVAIPDAPFQQNMQSWGLQLGVRYRINSGGRQHY